MLLALHISCSEGHQQHHILNIDIEYYNKFHISDIIRGYPMDNYWGRVQRFSGLNTHSPCPYP